MTPDPQYWNQKRVCVTGGTGFLGLHLVQQLQSLGAAVRVFGLRPRAPEVLERLKGVECHFGDVRDANLAREALGDCDVVFHAAGPVATWGPALEVMHDVHVTGTKTVLAAAPNAARVVHTSSIVAVGASLRREPLNEGSEFNLGSLRLDYARAKRGAELIVLEAAGRGRDVVVVNPSYLVGPDDFECSFMGQFFLRCWRGQLILSPPGGINCVDVRDAARGHLLAAERGVAGRRYILGGEDLTMRELVRRTVGVQGKSSWWRLTLPMPLSFAYAGAAELVAKLGKWEPYPTVQIARSSRYFWYYSNELARRELGFEARPFSETLRDTYAWYRETRRV